MKKMISTIILMAMFVNLLPAQAFVTEITPGKVINGEYVLAINTNTNSSNSQNTGNLIFDDGAKNMPETFSENNNENHDDDLHLHNIKKAENISSTAITSSTPINDIYTIGQQKDFYNGNFELIAIGNTSYIWIEKGLKKQYDAIGKTNDLAQEAIDVYNSGPYQFLQELSSNNFPYADNSGKLSILLEIMQPAGYFADEPGVTAIHVRTNPANRYYPGMLMQYNGLIVHEAQHAIFASKTSQGGGNFAGQAAWINEGISVAAMDLFWGGSDPSGWISQINGNSDIRNGESLIYSGYRNNPALDYSRPSLFVRYLANQFSKGFDPMPFYKQFYTPSKDLTQEQYINKILKNAGLKHADGTDLTFKQALINFNIALIAQEASGVYGFYADPIVYKDLTNYPLYIGESGASTNIKGTGSLIFKTKNGSFTIPQNAGADIKFIAFNKNGTPITISGGGDGTSSNPFILKTVRDLDALTAYPNSHFELGADIDLTNQQFFAISNFKGVLDGRNFTISGLHNTLIKTNLGIIKNLNVIADMSGTYFGTIGVLTNANNGQIMDTHISGNVNINITDRNTTFYNKFGVLTGDNTEGGNIDRSSVSANVTLNSSNNHTSIGLLAGRNTSRITNSFSSGSLNVTNTTSETRRISIGGLVGEFWLSIGSTSFLGNNYSTAVVTTNIPNLNPLVGRLVGRVDSKATETHGRSNYALDGMDAVGVVIPRFSNAINSKTDAQMKIIDTFVSWDFTDVWNMPQNQYPQLVKGSDIVINNIEKPNNTYYVGENLNLRNIFLNLSNGTKISVTKDMIKSFDNTSSGEIPVVGTYKGIEFTFNVTVLDATELSNLAINNNPKTSYFVGETFNTDALVLRANINGRNDVLINSGYIVSKTTALDITDTNIRITYGTASVGSLNYVDIPITVTQEILKAEEIIIITKPTKTSAYYEDQLLDLTGLTAKIKYTNGTYSKLLNPSDLATNNVKIAVAIDGHAEFLDHTKPLTLKYNDVPYYAYLGNILPGQANAIFTSLARIRVLEKHRLADQTVRFVIDGYDLALTEEITGGSKNFSTRLISGTLPQGITVDFLPSETNTNFRFYSDGPQTLGKTDLLYRITDNISNLSIDVTISIDITPPSSKKDIISFDILKTNNAGKITEDVIGKIDGDQITLIFKEGTDITSLAPDILTNADGTDWKTSPRGGSFQDFTSPVMYEAIAEDTSRKSYTVTSFFNETLPAPSNLEWQTIGASSTDKFIKFNRVPKAIKYELELYKGSQKVGKTIIIDDVKKYYNSKNNIQYYFEDIKIDGTYSFKVRAIADGQLNQNSAYATSSQKTFSNLAKRETVKARIVKTAERYEYKVDIQEFNMLKNDASAAYFEAIYSMRDMPYIHIDYNTLVPSFKFVDGNQDGIVEAVTIKKSSIAENPSLYNNNIIEAYEKYSTEITKIIEKITPGMNVAQKLLTVHKNVKDQNSYATDNTQLPYKQSSYSRLVLNDTIHTGYTEAFFEIVNILKIVPIIDSYEVGGNTHSWNKFKIDDDYYNFDSASNSNNTAFLTDSSLISDNGTIHSYVPTKSYEGIMLPIQEGLGTKYNQVDIEASLANINPSEFDNDKTLLAKQIAKAKLKLAGTIPGSSVGQYNMANRKAFTDSLNLAITEFNNIYANANDIEIAMNQLESAQNTYVLSKLIEDMPQLDSDEYISKMPEVESIHWVGNVAHFNDTSSNFTHKIEFFRDFVLDENNVKVWNSIGEPVFVNDTKYDLQDIMRINGIYNIKVTVLSNSKTKIDSDTIEPTTQQTKTDGLVSLIKLSGPTNIQWNDKTVTFSADTNATKYEIELYKDNVLVGEKIITNATSHDFSNQMSDFGQYVVKIKSIGNLGILYDNSDIVNSPIKTIGNNGDIIYVGDLTTSPNPGNGLTPETAFNRGDAAYNAVKSGGTIRVVPNASVTFNNVLTINKPIKIDSVDGTGGIVLRHGIQMNQDLVLENMRLNIGFGVTTTGDSSKKKIFVNGNTLTIGHGVVTDKSGTLVSNDLTGMIVAGSHNIDLATGKKSIINLHSGTYYKILLSGYSTIDRDINWTGTPANMYSDVEINIFDGVKFVNSGGYVGGIFSNSTYNGPAGNQEQNKFYGNVSVNINGKSVRMAAIDITGASKQADVTISNANISPAHIMGVNNLKINDSHIEITQDRLNPFEKTNNLTTTGNTTLQLSGERLANHQISGNLNGDLSIIYKSRSSFTALGAINGTIKITLDKFIDFQEHDVLTGNADSNARVISDNSLYVIEKRIEENKSKFKIKRAPQGRYGVAVDPNIQNGRVLFTISDTVLEPFNRYEVTVEVYPDSGYRLKPGTLTRTITKTGDIAEVLKYTNGTFGYPMPDGDTVIKAEFELLPEIFYDITIASNIQNGSITANKSTAKQGEVITFTATPNSGYELDKISVNAQEITGNTFTMQAENINVSATFKLIPEAFYDITIANNIQNGSITANKSTAKQGEVITFTATPNSGYELDKISVNSQVITGNTFTMQAENINVSATFKLIPEAFYDITIASNIQNGKITVDKTIAKQGEVITFTATPNSGYELDKISVNAQEITGNTFTMQAENINVSATFKLIPETFYDITIASNIQNGKITADKTIAKQGEVITFTATPNSGYRLSEISVNSQVITGNTFTMQAKNILVRANFTLKINQDIENNPITLKLISSTQNSITLLAQGGQGETGATEKFEYAKEEISKSKFRLRNKDLQWQDSPIFSNLKPSTEYNFYAKRLGDNTYLDALIKAPVTIKTQDPIILPTPKLQLWDISLTQQEGRPLVRASGDPTDDGNFNFKSKVSNYNLYLRSIDTKQITLNIVTFDTDENVTILSEGNVYTAQRDARYDDKFLPITINVVNGGEYQIIVEQNGNQSIYTINVFVNTLALDPQIFAEVKAYAGSNNAQLTFIGKKIEFDTLTLTIDINNFDILGGFINQNGNYLDGEDLGQTINRLTGEIIEDININFKGLHKDVIVSKLSSTNGRYIHLVLENKKLNGEPVIIDNETSLISFNLELKNSQNLNDITNALSVSTGTEISLNESFARRYKNIYDTEQVNDEETFVSIRRVKPEIIKMILNHDSANNRLRFEVYDLENDTLITTENSIAVDGINLRYELYRGTFAIKVIAKGYLTLNYKDITYNGTPTKNGIKIQAIDLLEGDLNQDNIIDLTDRAILIQNYGQIAQNDVILDADYNDDSRINGLDLGRLLSNIGKRYSVSDTIYDPNNN